MTIPKRVRMLATTRSCICMVILSEDETAAKTIARNTPIRNEPTPEQIRAPLKLALITNQRALRALAYR